MADHPRPYKGQNPRVEDEADEFSTWHDLSNPGLLGTGREPEDALDPDRPSGAQTTPSAALLDQASDIPDGIRWMRYENIGKK